jgi:hypothetical protein
LEASKCWLALARFLPNIALQVFDRRVAGWVGVSSRSEGEREGWRAPEGSSLHHVHGDMVGVGWGSYSGEGARVSKGSCLGTKRSSGWLLRALFRSEGQRGSGELEVFDLGLCPERG